VAVSKHSDLRRLSFRLSADRNRAFCMVRDDLSGRFLALPNGMADAVHRVRMALLGDGAGTANLSQDDQTEAARFTTSIRMLRDQDLMGAKRFNPVFINLPLFEVGPFQPALRTLARFFVSWFAVAFVSLLFALTVVLGTRNDWAIRSAFENILSIEGLLTFAAVAPFLKLFHELGHVLVATRFDVPVRKAGFYIIGLYPMPYVDCSEADFRAERRNRILISIAGVWVDVVIGLSAFILWHFTSGTYLQTVLGNIFIYSALNSILFNLNPLIKLDGYYALVDLLGERNLYTRSQKTLSNLTGWIMTFGGGGLFPRGWYDLGLVFYALGAFIYRILIMYVIASTLLPQHFGLGAVVVAWGAGSMFLSPLLQDTSGPLPSARKTFRTQRWIMRGIILGGLACLLLFVKLSQFTTVELYLDAGKTYGVTSPVAGRVDRAIAMSPVEAGERLAQMSNAALQEELELLEFELASADLVLNSVRGDDPAKAAAATQQRNSLLQRRQILTTDQELLDIFSSRRGLFVPTTQLRPGVYLPSGAAVGVNLPMTGPSAIQGLFPERYLDKYLSGNSEAEIRMTGGGTFFVSPSALTLQPILDLNKEQGERFYRMIVTIDIPPIEMLGQRSLMRLSFRPEPLWVHVAFWWETQVLKFRDAQIQDRLGRLEN
jgi:putative peptide zinc metalloprotease protein